jgi:hypothetical protein
MDTTSTVWMGVTLAARCHNHKYDLFTQKEFYQMFAYFNQVPSGECVQAWQLTAGDTAAARSGGATGGGGAEAGVGGAAVIGN